MICPICGEGQLTEHTEKNIITSNPFDYGAKYICVETDYSLCDVCGCTPCTAEQMSLNSERAIKARGGSFRLLEHEGYKGTIKYSAQDDVFHGKLIGIDDLVTYEGNTYKELKEAFKESIEDYITLSLE